MRLFLGDKREWCCKNEGRCPPELTLSSTSSTTNCPDAIDSDDPAYCNTPIGTWPEEKREFCCKHFKRGCPDKKFDCDEDLKNHEWAWSEKRRSGAATRRKKVVLHPSTAILRQPHGRLRNGTIAVQCTTLAAISTTAEMELRHTPGRQSDSTGAACTKTSVVR